MQQFAQYFGLQYKPSAGAEEGGRRGRERKTVMTTNHNLHVWHTVRLGACKGMKAKMIEFCPTRKIPKKNLREYGHSPTLWFILCEGSECTSCQTRSMKPICKLKDFVFIGQCKPPKLRWSPSVIFLSKELDAIDKNGFNRNDPSFIPTCSRVLVTNVHVCPFKKYCWSLQLSQSTLQMSIIFLTAPPTFVADFRKFG